MRSGATKRRRAVDKETGINYNYSVDQVNGSRCDLILGFCGRTDDVKERLCAIKLRVYSRFVISSCLTSRKTAIQLMPQKCVPLLDYVEGDKWPQTQERLRTMCSIIIVIVIHCPVAFDYIFAGLILSRTCAGEGVRAPCQ